MVFEVTKSNNTVNEWRVEAIDFDEDGEIYVAMFSGPHARERAEEYAAWKNQGAQKRAERRPQVARERQRASA